MSWMRMAAATAASAFGMAWAAEGDWVFVPPETPQVSFHGLVDYDTAGSGPGLMLYPAPGLAGFIAAIATHGLIVKGARDSQKSEMRTQADKVLEPFQAVIGTLRGPDLLASALARMKVEGGKHIVDVAAPGGEAWIVESIPEYALTQDMRAVVLDGSIIVYRPGQRDKPAYANVVRVVSPPIPVALDPRAVWLSSEGKPLVGVAATLWSEAMDLALMQWRAPGDGPEKTVRYMQGANERMERAAVLAQGCGRLTLRTLRGELLSVPARGPADDCDPYRALFAP